MEPAATGEPPPAPIVDAQPADLEASAASTVALAADVHDKPRAAFGNLVWSPASLAVALTVTWPGAHQGDTAEQMAATLHLPGDPRAAHRAAGATLRLWATAPEGCVELTVADWPIGQRGYVFEGAFLGLLQIPPRTADSRSGCRSSASPRRRSVALRPVLAELGMRSAFDSGRAALCGMARPASPAERLHVHDVYHQAMMEVPEQGTVPAAASAVVVRARGAVAPEPSAEEVHADRPFLFALVHRRGGVARFSRPAA